jgi:hypothetical protein
MLSPRMLLPLLQGGETETREFLDWGYLPQAWVIFLVIIPLVIAFACFIYKREPLHANPRVWFFMATMRVLLILAVLLFLAQPVMRKVTFETQDPHVVVLIDDSLSAQIVDKYADREAPLQIAEVLGISPEAVERISRYDLVKRLLGDKDGGLIDQLREKVELTIFNFAGSVRRVGSVARKGREADEDFDFELPGTTEFKGDARVKETRIGDGVLEALASLSDNTVDRRDHSIMGVLLFTDGQSNAGALQPEEMAIKLKQRGIPLLAVGVGNSQAPKNIRVVSLDVSDVVLMGDRVPFDATILSDGFEGERVQVDLLFDDEVVASEFLNLGADGEKKLLRLEHRPRNPGDFQVSVQVEVLGGELFDEDNFHSRSIKVLDQKIKVLFLEGPPRWEYRYLMWALVRDPTMETNVFLLSADPEFRQESSEGIAPLRRFPTTEDELFQYHVIIIGDVRFNDPSLPPERRIGDPQMELIQKFVSEAGGGVVFLAGEGANPHRYVNTPLYPLLPVEIPEGVPDYDRTYGTPFYVKLTGPGREHPIMRIGADLDETSRLLEFEDGVDDSQDLENQLPGFYWFAPVKKVKLGGVALAVHETAPRSIYGPPVIFAIQNYGKGRTFFSAVDETWRWRAGVDNLYFYRFWGQVIRYVSTGRLLGKTPRYSLVTDKRVYTIGEKINVEAKVYDANMKPLTDPDISVFHSVKGHEGDLPEKIDLALNPIKGPGAYDGALVAGQLGSHDLWIGTEGDQQAFRTFAVEVPPLEFRNPRMDRERLIKVARNAEGKYYELYEVTDAVEFLLGAARPRQIPIEESRDDLWDEAWVLLAFTLLIAAEWICRKVFRLL